jgi:hypothetical protein
MNFGIIGEPCIDYIHKPGKETTRSLGGILYSVVSLAILSKNNAAVYPIMYLGTDEYDNIISFLNRFGNIKSDFIFRSPQHTRIVNLLYETHLSLGEGGRGVRYDRTETSTSPQPPLEFSNIKEALSHLDALLVNMVSGNDITLNTFNKIRSYFPGYIHIDLHNIMMRDQPLKSPPLDGVGKFFTRTTQPVENWLHWCMNSDTVQANEMEFRVMTGGINEYEIAERALSARAIHELPIHVPRRRWKELSPAPKALIVTRGKSGATLFQPVKKSIKGEKYSDIHRTDVAAPENPNFRDSTGCGDVFASAFFYKNAISEQHDYTKALKFAARIAGLKTALVGVEELCNLFRLQKSSKLS